GWGMRKRSAPLIIAALFCLVCTAFAAYAEIKYSYLPLAAILMASGAVISVSILMAGGRLPKFFREEAGGSWPQFWRALIIGLLTAALGLGGLYWLRWYMTHI